MSVRPGDGPSAEELATLGIACIRAENPGPLTLSGTNTWVVGSDPCWIVDPGPALEEHLEAVAAEARRRGGAGGIVVTHGHADHAAGLEPLRERLGRPPVGETGPLERMPLPGHSEDHVVYLWEGAAFTGDAVLGEGSVFVADAPGAMAAYLQGLRALRERDLRVLCPGHGPEIWDARGKLDGYIAHRLDRERRLLEALADGVRDEKALLDRVWADAPAVLLPAAAVTLRSHLHKLREEGRFEPPRN